MVEVSAAPVPPLYPNASMFTRFEVEPRTLIVCVQLTNAGTPETRDSDGPLADGERQREI